MGHRRITVSDGEPTPFGRILLAGEVPDAEPVVPRPLRVLDAYVISLVTAGRGSYRHGDGRTDPITEQTLTVVLPRDPHWYGTSTGDRWSEWFAVAEGPIFDLLVRTGRLTRSGPRPLPASARAGDLALLLGSPPSTSSAEQQIWALGQWLAGALVDETDGDAARWDRVADRLTTDLDRGLSIPDLAADFGMGYDEFRRGFREHFGRAPLAFRNDRRLELAATLLRVTNLTCREIARRLGYADEFHLSRRFRNRYGVSPTGYRRRG